MATEPPNIVAFLEERRMEHSQPDERWMVFSWPTLACGSSDANEPSSRPGRARGEVAKGTPLQQCDAVSNWVTGPQAVADSQSVACIGCAAWEFVLNLVGVKKRDLSAGLCTRTQTAIPCEADS